MPQALNNLVQRRVRVIHRVQRVQELLQRAPGLLRFRVLQWTAGVGVVFDGDTDGLDRGALPGKGLECLQGGPIRRGESQRDAGSVADPDSTNVRALWS